VARTCPTKLELPFFNTVASVGLSNSATQGENPRVCWATDGQFYLTLLDDLGFEGEKVIFTNEIDW
jgi:hypothetical protein